MTVFIVMGVCGSGKTSIGKCLAKKLGVEFADADDFHPDANKAKMAQGLPLTDEDRRPWLISIRQFILRVIQYHGSAVVTCSALKRCYRDLLTPQQPEADDVIFVHLKGSETLIRSRMVERCDHFMPVELLTSQLLTLEEPLSDEKHISVDISEDIETIVSNICDRLQTNAGQANKEPTP